MAPPLPLLPPLLKLVLALMFDWTFRRGGPGGGGGGGGGAAFLVLLLLRATIRLLACARACSTCWAPDRALPALAIFEANRADTLPLNCGWAGGELLPDRDE